MNIKNLLKYIISQLPTEGINLNWIIRAEVDTDEIDENQNLIALMQCVNQSELIYDNGTYKLDCNLTGQILIGALTTEEIDAELHAVYQSLFDYIKLLNYSNCDGAIVMDATIRNLELGVDNLYYTFTIPFTLYVQF